MRDASSTHGKLSIEQPGLHACLLQYLRDTARNDGLELADEKVRTRYIEINGRRIKDAEGASSVVREHIKVFFSSIFWYLHAYYGKEMEKNVMIIVAYREAVSSSHLGQH